ncbi:fatty acid oxidation complex subunit alpha FadB [Ramlibacter sp. WS9]|uniref:fatty acid oxidation complex subunit alpha FadB n=1 Tax=Ramlibacter sp. WS9 TaxID=1882741 RepID=UPI001143C249|nr:fatty acid oxidation complex subunit alpha FadB [Ramlibacter sp. WS9]ROZ68810.1 fatty acid oxidation complex subunit alpha FadB [Ramlibacter sp. WS9]
MKGKSIQILDLGEGVLELRFDRENEAINKLDDRTLVEFEQAVAEIRNTPGVRGVLVSSAKDMFIAGADITEFGASFSRSPAAIAELAKEKNQGLIAFEDLAVPSVVAINGFALGGGLELALGASLRVMSSNSQIGLPEVNLGLFPGLGGTVRLSRIAGLPVALEWVCGGKPVKAAAALAAKVVDAVAEPAAVRDEALALLRRAMAGEVDWKAAQERKRQPVPMAAGVQSALFDEMRAKLIARAPRHQPAALMALDMMREAAVLPRAEALGREAAWFGEVARTQAAASLVQNFLNDQAVKKQARQLARQGQPVRQAAVLGAGIMGGGIAYTSVLKGVPVRLKDISQPQLDLGVAEVRKQLQRLVKGARKQPAEAESILATVKPQLDYAGFDEVDLTIEAVVENLQLKHTVLAELEQRVRPDAVIATNTSSLRIDDIAAPLKRPENFVGMHFFNPVPVMPLVEVIRGARTSDAAVAMAVGHCVAMGKTPIVVKDCPGFLVNRILTAYVSGFLQLINEGADFVKVDQVMEEFGWPMGPAYLQDVVGMDTSRHVSDVIGAGYPERLTPPPRNALRLMVEHGRLGQKSGSGFYKYEADAEGKPRRSTAQDTHALLATLQSDGPREFAPQEIVDRMMLPLMLEAARALEEGVVRTPAELDMALLLGVGLPAYLGGALKYADWLGLAEVVARADKLAPLGAVFHVTPRMREMAAGGETFYQA